MHQHDESIDNDEARYYKRQDNFSKSNKVGNANVNKEPSKTLALHMLCSVLLQREDNVTRCQDACSTNNKVKDIIGLACRKSTTKMMSGTRMWKRSHHSMAFMYEVGGKNFDTEV